MIAFVSVVIPAQAHGRQLKQFSSVIPPFGKGGPGGFDCETAKNPPYTIYELTLSMNYGYSA